MPDETTALVTTPSPTEQPRSSYMLAARDAKQMQEAQAGLSGWLKDKLYSLTMEATEVTKSRDEAKAHKWKCSGFTPILTRIKQRQLFYEKVLAAVEAGYTIVPNFPIDVFAIRVTRECPEEGTQTRYGNPADYRAEKPDVSSPVGEGEYVSPKPGGSRYQFPEKNASGQAVTKHQFVPTSFREADFPVAAAQSIVMDATADAMAIKAFDRIGIAPQSGRVRGKGDPLIIAQVCLDKPAWGEPKKIVSFLVAWHLDLRTL